MASNTLLIVTSDNGSHWLQADEKHFEHLANGDWRGQKADIHEGGHRVPFLVRWPGKAPAGVVRADLVCLTDLFATFAELTEQPIAEGEAEDSFSMLPVLHGQEAGPSARSEVVHHSGAGVFAVRSGPWKLILGLGSGGFTNPKQVKAIAGGPKGQLYNLELDPSESDNLWSEQPEIVTRLTAKLNAWREAGRTR
jgi:arylsulfatase A-like enzyme